MVTNSSLIRFLPYVGMVTIVMNDYPWLKVGCVCVCVCVCAMGL